MNPHQLNAYLKESQLNLHCLKTYSLSSWDSYTGGSAKLQTAFEQFTKTHDNTLDLFKKLNLVGGQQLIVRCGFVLPESGIFVISITTHRIFTGAWASTQRLLDRQKNVFLKIWDHSGSKRSVWLG